MTARMTVAQFRAAQKGPTREKKTKKASKYGSEKQVVDGLTFDSKREAARYAELCTLQRAGMIRDLQLQVKIVLQGKGGPLLGENGRQRFYKADFQYIDTDTGETIIEDAKGFKTKEYSLKKSILKAQGIEVIEV